MMIGNGKNTPLNANSGTVPNVGDALLNWFQPLTFGVVTTTVQNFRSVQTQVQVQCKGVWQPFTDKQLMLKPEGERARSWWWLHADPSLTLEPDSVVTYLGVQYRVMSQKDYRLYGYVEYQLVQGWTGSGPTVVTP
jgi:hypothetical protein